MTNDLSVECRNEIGLAEWVTDEFGKADDLDAISASVQSFLTHDSAAFLDEVIEDGHVPSSGVRVRHRVDVV